MRDMTLEDFTAVRILRTECAKNVTVSEPAYGLYLAYQYVASFVCQLARIVLNL
jgi:hypothetical protein